MYITVIAVNKDSYLQTSNSSDIEKGVAAPSVLPSRQLNSFPLFKTKNSIKKVRIHLFS